MSSRINTEALSVALQQISAAGLSEQAFNMTAEPAGRFLPGKFSSVSSSASGGSAGAELSGMAGTGLVAGLKIGCYGFIPSEDNLSSFGMGAAADSSGWHFEITDEVSVAPSIGGGISFLRAKTDFTGSSAGTQILAKAVCSLGSAGSDRLEIVFEPGYLMMIESEGQYSSLSLALGTSYRIKSIDEEE